MQNKQKKKRVTIQTKAVPTKTTLSLLSATSKQRVQLLWRIRLPVARALRKTSWAEGVPPINHRVRGGGDVDIYLFIYFVVSNSVAFPTAVRFIISTLWKINNVFIVAWRVPHVFLWNAPLPRSHVDRNANLSVLSSTSVFFFFF